MKPFRDIRSNLVFCLGCLLTPFAGLAGTSEISPEAAPVIRDYVETMGGTAPLERIQSIRLEGTIAYPDGSAHAVTVLKKKPDRIRITVNTGRFRLIQAYDGETAWIGQESGNRRIYRRMDPDRARIFIREAPLENVLVNPSGFKARIHLGEDVQIAAQPGHQVIADLPDGSRFVYHIEKATALERRIFEYDPQGNLVAELIPGKFEIHHGVLFAMQVIRRVDGETVSTMSLDQIEANIGILDTAFSPPHPLPVAPPDGPSEEIK